MSPPSDHHHDHDHDHPHDHGEHGSHAVHEPPPLAPRGVAGVEDADTHALAEALRSSFVIVKVIMVLLVVVFFVSGVFIVPPQEKAIILRFGKPLGTGEEQLLGPGLHWSWPYPIDEVVSIKVGQLHTLASTVAWHATPPGMENAPAENFLDLARDGYALTADGNILHVRATLDYRISDPLRYEFAFSNTSNLVQNALNNAILYASSRYTVDRALRLDIVGFKETITKRLGELIDAQSLGVTIESADVRVAVPRYISPNFDDVLKAEQQRNTAINQARGYEGEVLLRALQDSNAVMNASMAEYVRLTNSVASEARYLAERSAEYERHPELFRQRMLVDTMQRVLTNAQDVFLLREGNGGTRELRLLLSREPAKRQAPPEPASPEHGH